MINVITEPSPELIPEANPKKALIGISTISEAVTRMLGSKSVFPPQMAERTSTMMAPMNRPIIAPIMAQMKAITPTAPPNRLPVTVPTFRRPHSREKIPAITP